MYTFRTFASALVAIVTSTVAATLPAATITWTNDVGGFGTTASNASTDVFGQGTFIDALYFGTGGTQTAGADTFYQAIYPTPTTAQSPSGDISLTYPGTTGGTGPGISPTGYGTVLGDGVGFSSGGRFSADPGGVGVAIQFSNLTFGATYVAQFWVSQNRGDEYVMSLTAGNTIDLKAESSAVTNPPSPGQFAVGTFVADATSEIVTLNYAFGGNGPFPFINAIALRSVPEPGSVMLMILGGLGLCFVGWRRRRTG